MVWPRIGAGPVLFQGKTLFILRFRCSLPPEYGAAGKMKSARIFGNLSQETIVFFLAAALFVAAAVALPGFLQTNNLISIVRSVSVLGVLAVGMGIVIIGRGIDL